MTSAFTFKLAALFVVLFLFARITSDYSLRSMDIAELTRIAIDKTRAYDHPIIMAVTFAEVVFGFLALLALTIATTLWLLGY